MPRRISAHTPHNAVRTARIPRRLLWTVCFLSAALCIWQLAVYKGACMNMGDAYSYYGAYDHLRHLQLDDIRPPVYPLFYGIMYAIFGHTFCAIGLCATQWAIYAGTMLLVWDICMSLRLSRMIGSAVVLAYFLFPCFWCYNNVCLPESLSGCLLVALIWSCARYHETHRKAYLWGGAALLLILIFTKPMFVSLIPVMALWWAAVAAEAPRRHRRRAILTAAMLVAATSLPVMVYAMALREKTGVTMLAKSTLLNRYATLRMAGIISPTGETQRPDITGVWQELSAQTPAQISAAIDSASAGRTGEVGRAYLRQFMTAAHSPHFEILCDRDGTPLDPREYPGWTETLPGWYIYPFHGAFARFPVWAGLALGAIFIILWSLRGPKPLRRNLTAPLTALAYFTLTFCAMAGAPNDWGRILIPVSSLLPIMEGASVAYLTTPRKPRHHANG